jgi:ribosomal protein L32
MVEQNENCPECGKLILPNNESYLVGTYDRTLDKVIFKKWCFNCKNDLYS